MFKALTGVRGAAAVLVMLYHYLVFQHLDDARFSPLGPGYLAVDLFFILSGFLMAMNYRDSFRTGFHLGGYRSFMARRFARVYPLYAVITLTCIALQSFSHALPKITILSNILLIQQFGLGLIKPLAGGKVSMDRRGPSARSSASTCCFLFSSTA